MKNYSSTIALLKEIDKWRSLEADIRASKPGCEQKKSYESELKEIRTCCKHSVYAHLSTDYRDDGLGDPDFFSSYKCMVCGSTAYDVPSYREDSSTYCINMHHYRSEQHYADDEKFALAEYMYRQLVEEHPDYSIKQIITLLNEKIAKK